MRRRSSAIRPAMSVFSNITNKMNLSQWSSVVRVGDLRSQSPTVNREKVTKGRQLSNVRDFARGDDKNSSSGISMWPEISMSDECYPLKNC